LLLVKWSIRRLAFLTCPLPRIGQPDLLTGEAMPSRNWEQLQGRFEDAATRHREHPLEAWRCVDDDGAQHTLFAAEDRPALIDYDLLAKVAGDLLGNDPRAGDLIDAAILAEPNAKKRWTLAVLSGVPCDDDAPTWAEGGKMDGPQFTLFTASTLLIDRLLSKGKADASAAGGDKAELSKEQIALAVLAKHPDWTDTKVAEEVGCKRTSLYRMKTYRKAREAMAAGWGELPKGSKFDAVDGWNGDENE
jgi:hypothetical protein